MNFKNDYAEFVGYNVSMNKSGKNRAINELETSNNPDTTEVGESNAEVLEYEGAAVEDIQLEDTEEIVTVDAEPPEKADVDIREGGDIEAAEEALTTSEKPEAGMFSDNNLCIYTSNFDARLIDLN